MPQARFVPRSTFFQKFWKVAGDLSFRVAGSSPTRSFFAHLSPSLSIATLQRLFSFSRTDSFAWPSSPWPPADVWLSDAVEREAF